MPYQWPLDPRELFTERYPQMVNTGLSGRRRRRRPRGDRRDVGRSSRVAGFTSGPSSRPGTPPRVVTTWPCWPTGGRSSRCSPTTPSGSRSGASWSSTSWPRRASRSRFERRVLELPYEGRTTPVAIHLLVGTRPDGAGAGAARQWRRRQLEARPASAVRRHRPGHRRAGGGVRHSRHRRVPDSPGSAGYPDRRRPDRCRTRARRRQGRPPRHLDGRLLLRLQRARGPRRRRRRARRAGRGVVRRRSSLGVRDGGHRRQRARARPLARTPASSAR